MWFEQGNKDAPKFDIALALKKKQEARKQAGVSGV
jgi:hypothetical protein